MLSRAFEQELCLALKVTRLQTGFAEEIAAVLHRTNGAHESKQKQAQRIDAVRRLVKAGGTLQIAIKRADAVFQMPRAGRWFIPSTWQASREPLDHMVDVLQQWLLLHDEPGPRRRGNPHEGQRRLRVGVFGALKRAGVPISKSATGPAAKTLRAVLEEADRRDGKPARFRANFNGSWWGYWVAEYKYISKMAEENPRLSSLDAWVRTHPSPQPPQSGK
jgi:hypothetical protein